MNELEQVFTSHVLHTNYGFNYVGFRKTTTKVIQKTIYMLERHSKELIFERLTISTDGLILYYRHDKKINRIGGGRTIFKLPDSINQGNWKFIFDEIWTWYQNLDRKRNKDVKSTDEDRSSVILRVKVEVQSTFFQSLKTEIQEIIDKYKMFEKPYLSEEEVELLLNPDQHETLRWFDSQPREKKVKVILWSNQHMESLEGLFMGYDPTGFIPKIGEDLEKFDQMLREFFFSGFITNETVEW